MQNILIIDIVCTLAFIFCYILLLSRIKANERRLDRNVKALDERCKNLLGQIWNLEDSLRDGLAGTNNKLYIKTKIAEKFAERAFNMASSAQLGVVAVQKALTVPRLLTKEQIQRNQIAKKQVNELFSTEGYMDLLRPLMSEEENDLLDKAQELKRKEQLNGQ